ncbi:unnamed protein product [Clonostachys byssicola]|uniref:PNPLA domain-containing protein n=1 Tax=Clonostachys byssicola TaxID=160290 RepID=A0A9N9YCQ8_9HYPO|nr:unnamed protein product [Clonostachys byssicola]
MGIDSCIDAYIKLSKDIFTPRKRNKILGKNLLKITGQAAYSHNALEDAIKHVIRQSGIDENAPLLESAPKCKMFVCASLSNTQTICLRNYRSSLEDNISCTIWEAARATSAAPTFFDPITLSNGLTFRDGALRGNNPIYELIREADCEASGVRIRAIASIGTGLPRTIAISNHLTSIAKACARIATDTENTANRFYQSFCLPGCKYEDCYFRFNVEQGMQGIGLHEWQKVDIMTSSTLSYMQEVSVATKLAQCASKLLGKTATVEPTIPIHADIRSKSRRPSQYSSTPLSPSKNRGDGQNYYIDHDLQPRPIGSVGSSSQSAEPPQRALIRQRRPRSEPELHHQFFQLDRIGKKPVPYFVHRKEISQIGKWFEESSTSKTSRTVVLAGLGGSGKTQIMLRYAWLSRNKYGVVLWFDGKSFDSLNESFRLAASQLGLRIPAHETPSPNARSLSKSTDFDGDLELIKRELRRRRQSWLLLFDQVDDLAVIDRLREFIPSDPNGRILVCSRRQEARSLVRKQAIFVKGMPVDGARQLLLYHANIEEPTEEDLYYAEKVVMRLECIALAVDLAGRFASSLGSLKEYLVLYESEEANIRDQIRVMSMGTTHPIASGYENSIIAAWRISIQAIPPDTASFLYLLCFLDRSNLSMDMFRRACSAKAAWKGTMNDSKEILLPEDNRVPSWLLQLFCDENGNWSGVKFYSEVQKLSSFFFLQKEVLGGVWLHATGAVDSSSLTSTGSSIVLLNLPQPVYDLGRYYLDRNQRREFSYSAFAILVHSFRNSLGDRTLVGQPREEQRHTLLRAGRGGVVATPAHLQRWLEEGYNHLLVFKDDIKPSERFTSSLFTQTRYPRWHIMELILFSTIFWPEIMTDYDATVLRPSGDLPPGGIASPWKTIVEIAQNVMYLPKTVQWGPRTSGTWNAQGQFERKGNVFKDTWTDKDAERVTNVPEVLDAFENMDRNFERKWTIRQTYYFEILASSSIYQRLGFLRQPMHRISALAEATLLQNRTAIPATILDHIERHVIESFGDVETTIAPSTVFQTWLRSPLGLEFSRRCELPPPNRSNDKERRPGDVGVVDIDLDYVELDPLKDF